MRRIEEIENKALFRDYSKSAASPLLEGTTYPWEVLPLIHDFILKLGASLPDAEYEKRGEDIWIARDAKVFPSAYIGGPCIIGHRTEVRHCAFIRENALIGDDCVVGNSTELKNVILFDQVEVPHYNYVGDSILGCRAHMGAGSITSNIKADRKDIEIKYGPDFDPSEGDDKSGEIIKIETGMQKIGAFLGDYVEIGCGTVLNPGSIVGPETNIYPLNSVRGVIPAEYVYKDKEHIVRKK